MVPLQKLQRLPRRQRLRKIAKLMDEADRRAAGAMPPMANQTVYLGYLCELAVSLLSDTELRPEVLSAIRAAAVELNAAYTSFQAELPRRPLNQLRHILAQEVGKQEADWDFVDGSGKLEGKERRIFPGVELYLEDIRSPFNVGSIFRTAESFGVERILMSPLCASPEHKRAERSAMGCTGLVAWESRSLDTMTGPFFALETGGTRVDEFAFPERGVMIVGSEELGVSPEGLALADNSLGRVTIPMYGAKGSLNVAVAFGIAMHWWAQRRSSFS